MTTEFDRRALMGALGLGAAGAALPAWAQREAPPPPPGAPMPVVPGLPAAPAPSVNVAADIDGRIAQFARRAIADNKIQGCVTVIARKNKLVHFQAHGKFDVETGAPMPTDALMVMMSSTKPVTGVALLQQIERGKVKLTNKISKYIPELKDMKVQVGGGGRGASATPVQTVPAEREITIKDLATHTSGLNTAPRRPDGVPNTLAAVIPLCKDVPLAFQPGTRWAYSASIGPDVLARVVEITSGMPYDEYLKQNIFDPCGMKDTAHNLTDAQRARVVHRAQFQNGRWSTLGGAGATRNTRTTYMAGGYGLQSTAMDYLLFETMLLNRGMSASGNRVLKASSVDLMHRNLIGDLYKGLNGTTQGTGFGVLVRTVLDPDTCGCGREVGGFGWGGAYGTMSWTDPENDLVGVYFVQQPVDELRQEFEYVVKSTLS